MKVKAISDGYFNREIRKKGDIFDVPDGEIALWFVPLRDDKPDKPKKEHEKKPA